MLEAIDMCERITGKKMSWSYTETNRIGDHIWWISDVRRFQSHYPGWKYQYGLEQTLVQIHDELARRAAAAS
jgi:CDP-paratose 2-epimerase